MRTTRNVAAMVATAAAAVALPLTTATAASAAGAPHATPDLNGDGTPDRAELQAVGDGSTQQLTFVVDGKRISASMPGDAYAGLQPLRVTDVNADGRQEVAVNQSVGANTEHFTMWELSATGPRELHVAGRGALELTEGGGVAARTGYGCASDAEGDRTLVTLGATSNLDNPSDPHYTGKRTEYSVRDGVATPVGSTPFRAVPHDDPLLQVDPATCR